MSLQALYETLFGSLSNGFYLLSISYMIGFPLYWLWNKFIMHQKKKEGK